MNSETLRIFLTVASELSVTHAATRLGRAPSNVTTRIQQLETDIGTQLFIRTGKRMSLSSAGEHFVDYARRLLALEEEARNVVTGGRDGGVLRIGSMESTAASRLPTLLARYHTLHPSTLLDLSTGPSRPLLERVRNGQLDCAFVALPTSINQDDLLPELGLKWTSVWNEELCILLPVSESATSRFGDIKIRSLAAFPQGCTYRSIAEELLGIAGSTEWKVQEMPSYHVMIACTAAGASATLVPRSVLELTSIPEGLKTLPAGHADTLLVWREGYNTPAFTHFLAQISED